MSLLEELSEGEKEMYVMGTIDLAQAVLKHIDRLLSKQKYGFDIDSRLLVDAIVDDAKDVFVKVWLRS